mgnify:CR=1 FL=1
MTRTILSTVLLLTCSVLCQAQEKTSDYYWYRGKQIEVKVNHDNLLVYYKNPSVTEEHLIQTYGIKPEGVAEQDYDYDKKIYYNVFSFDSNQYDSIYQGLLREENVLSVQRCYGEDIPTPTGRHFYVNLKSAEDISLLEDITENIMVNRLSNCLIIPAMFCMSEKLFLPSMLFRSDICIKRIARKQMVFR